MSDVGPLLKHWRNARRLSQLALAAESTVSVRHLSFIETGRASPSRAMVLKLSEALDVPLRERNVLLIAAGFAPVYEESALDTPALAAVREALDAILAQQEPYPALVIDRGWNIRQANDAARRFFAFLTAELPRQAPGPPNLLRRMFHPDGIRQRVLNWPDVAENLVRRVRREAIGGVTDDRAQGILTEVLGYPAVPPSLRALDITPPTVPVVSVRYACGGRNFDYFSTVTTLGTAQDVTLQELRIESFFPLNEATRAEARRLADQPSSSSATPSAGTLASHQSAAADASSVRPA